VAIKKKRNLKHDHLGKGCQKQIGLARAGGVFEECIKSVQDQWRIEAGQQ
jgi:hypothetical protein